MRSKLFFDDFFEYHNKSFLSNVKIVVVMFENYGNKAEIWKIIFGKMIVFAKYGDCLNQVLFTKFVIIIIWYIIITILLLYIFIL